MRRTDEQAITDQILKMERAALDRWGKGDPDGYLEISAPDMTYFDPFLENRLDSFKEVKEWLDGVRGKIKIERDEIIDPRVQVVGDAAILTMRFVSEGSEGRAQWNCTEVYRRLADGWKIIHTHWSYTKPESPTAA
jgi:ketosteroid isomerase-like protein